MLHAVAFNIAFLIVVGAVACWALFLLLMWVLVKLLEYSPEEVCDFCGGPASLHIYSEAGRYADVCAWCLDDLANEGATLGDPYGFVWFKVGDVYKCNNVFERSPKEVKGA